MRAGGWYYKDRLGRTRGPMELVNLKTAWAAGIVDKNTFIWGDDMDEWAPIGMVYGLETAVATPDSMFSSSLPVIPGANKLCLLNTSRTYRAGAINFALLQFKIQANICISFVNLADIQSLSMLVVSVIEFV